MHLWDIVLKEALPIAEVATERVMIDCSRLGRFNRTPTTKRDDWLRMHVGIKREAGHSASPSSRRTSHLVLRSVRTSRYSTRDLADPLDSADTARPTPIPCDTFDVRSGSDRMHGASLSPLIHEKHLLKFYTPFICFFASLCVISHLYISLKSYAILFKKLLRAFLSLYFTQ